MHINLLIPALAFIIQMISAALVFRLLCHIGKRAVALILLLTIVLMAFRRLFSAYRFFTEGMTKVDGPAEAIGLVVSCLILTGIIYFTRLVLSEAANRNAASSAEERYRVLFDQSPDGVLLFDEQGRIVDFNDQACRQFGYSRDELRTLRISDIDLVESNNSIEMRFEQIQTSRDAEFEGKYRTKDGELRDVKVVARKVRLEGRPYQHTIWRDVTELKRAEGTLQESQSHLRAIFEQGNDGITVADLDGRYIMVNPVFSAMTGYSQNELLNMRVHDLLPRQTTLPLFPPAAVGKIGARREVELKRKDGSTFMASISGSILQIGEKQFVHGIVQDITERRIIQEQLEQKTAEQNAILENAVAGIVFLRDRWIIWINRKTEEMFGYDKGEMNGQTTALFYPTANDAEQLGKEAYPLLAGGKTYHTERLMKRKDGSTFWCSLSGKAIEPSSSAHGSIWILQDITERKRAEKELDRYRQTLEEMVLQRTEELQKTIAQLISEIRERAAIAEDLKTNRVFLNNILNSIQDPIMVLDRNRHIMMANHAFEKIFMAGVAVHSPARTCHEVFYRRTEPCENCLSQSSMLSGEMASRMIPFGKEESGLKLYDVHAFPFFTADGRAIGSVHHLRDITDRRQAEEKIVKYQQHLRSFAHQLMTTEERERRKIAQELHDGFPQKLALSKMLLQTIQTGGPGGDGSAQMFTRIYEIYDDMTNEVRSLTYQLAPPVLYEVGLEPALERMLKNMLTGVKIEWQFENWRKSDPIKGEIATVVYSMARELVMNVIKYAGARRLKVTVAQLDDWIVTVVQDDGKGLPEGTERQEQREREMGGFGLFSIRERLRYLNGRLTIDSGPGKGTIVRIDVPCGSRTTLADRFDRPSA